MISSDDVLASAVALTIAHGEPEAGEVARLLDTDAYRIEDVLIELVEAGMLTYEGETNCIGDRMIDHRGKWDPTPEGILRVLGVRR